MKEKKYISAAGIKLEYGFTDSMIKQYLGEPDKRSINPYYHSAPMEKLWLISKVKEIVENPEVKSKLEKLEIRRQKAKEKKELLLIEKQKRIEETAELLNAYSLEYLVDCSKKYPKEYHVHCGPTNSGKTYNALKNVNVSTKGQYLGPLRLLAYETAYNLNKRGVPCTLKTGEEEKRVDGAIFTASTIEMADLRNEMDYAIVDEAQLISDDFRGHNYTEALLLLKAKEIHVCVSPIGLNLILDLLKKTGMKITVNEYERLAPLKYTGYLLSFKNLKKGDALIVFSRRRVIEVSDMLEKMNISTSMIYGNLPPANRLVEVNKFNNKESDVVVCTDAIGMGVSLPIHRVIFLEDKKYDGQELRKLTNEEVMQIAGRAGRYGQFEDGEYLFWHEIPNTRFKTRNQSLTISIPFPKEFLYSDIDLDLMLSTWNNLNDSDLIKHQNLKIAYDLFKEISLIYTDYNRYKRLVFSLITCPFDAKSYDLLYLWREYAFAVLDNREFDLPIHYHLNTLSELEHYYKEIELYNHMMQIAGKNPETETLMEEVSSMIDQQILENKNRIKERKNKKQKNKQT